MIQFKHQEREDVENQIPVSSWEPEALRSACDNTTLEM